MIDEDHDESDARATRGGKRAATTAGGCSVFSRGRLAKTRRAFTDSLYEHRAPGLAHPPPAPSRQPRGRLVWRAGAPPGDGPRRGHIAEASKTHSGARMFSRRPMSAHFASGHASSAREDINNDQHGVAEREA